MASPRPPKGTSVDKNSGYDYRFPDDQAARDYVLKQVGRTPGQLARLATAGILGAAISKIVRQLENRAWLWGDRSLADWAPSEPIMDACVVDAGPDVIPPECIPAALEEVRAFASDALRAMALVDELTPVARKVRAFLETTGAEENLPKWKYELQMIAAFTHFAAESEKLDPPLGHKEMEAIALIVGFRPPDEEFLRDPVTTRERSENWRRTLDRAESNGIIEVLRKTAPTPESQPATAPEKLGASVTKSGDPDKS